jgi:GNAT superfamily N-acetyltransferase
MTWYSRRLIADSRVREICLHFGAEHEDGAVVDTPSADTRPIVTARVLGADVLSVRVDRTVAPRVPAMWFVAQPEPAAQPPAMNLVAFDTPHQPEGAVVSAAAFTAMPVRSSRQLAAVRWFTGTGQVHQVYVAPTARRRGIATVLLLAAGTYAVASGWPRLWGNGERTDLGEALVTGGHDVIRRRAVTRTRVLPPMTPGERPAR